MNVRAWPAAGVVFAVLWIFVRGIALEPAALAGQFLAGLLIGLPVAFVFRRLYVERVDLARLARASPYVGRYLAAFSVELIRANFDVAYRVLAPRVKIEPEVILVPLRVREPAAVTVIADSITLTPGTVALDHDPETNALYVHAIDGRDPEAIAAPIRTWEDYALEIFDEELSAADPPPEIITGREDVDGTGDQESEPTSPAERRSTDDDDE